jgi:hypothetical protein
MCVFFIFPNQLAGNTKFMVGVSFLMLAPLIRVAIYNAYTDGRTEEEEILLDRIHLFLAILKFSGILLIVYWAILSWSRF